ncbi:GNAT family N-acetyltransferase [Lysinibacillus sphaericus]|uniref:GNAT family N-acetyltransferase n=1 Tax=Lysinibacillus sphaericus TaxID=1421 RepID=UPI001CBC1E50|nr:GNAT family N-acetyltransferase [Lysinibacillus sphaericus]
MLETKRLKLRDYNEADFDFLQSLLSNAQVMQYIGSGETRNEEQARSFFNWIFESYEKNEAYGLKIIELKATNERIGHAGLVPQRVIEEEQIEIGYWIAPNFWGMGYATEVAKALRAYGEKELSLNKLISLIQIGNSASQKVAISMGMKKEREIELKGKQVIIFSTLGGFIS